MALPVELQPRLDVLFGDSGARYWYVTQESMDLAAHWRSLVPPDARIAIDIETTERDPFYAEIVLVQLKVRGLPALVLDCRGDASAGSHAQMSQVRKFLRPIVESDSYLKLAHNAGFEYRFIKHHFGLSMQRIFDTMLAEQILTAGLAEPCGLSDVVFRRLGVRMDKTLQTSFGVTGPYTAEQLEYAVFDVEVLEEIAAQQSVEMKGKGLIDVARQEFDLLPVVGDMSLYGVLIDEERWRAHIESMDRERALLEVELVAELTPYVEEYRRQSYDEQAYRYQHELAEYEAQKARRTAEADALFEQYLSEGTPRGEARKKLNEWKRQNKAPQKPPAPVLGTGPINLSSYPQLQGALDSMGVRLPRKSSGTLETGRRDLETVAEDYPIVEKILRWRGYQKLVSSFGDNILEMRDGEGRLHPDFQQLVSTGRMSCRTPNVQQIPSADKELGKEFRRSFVAPPGRKLVSADYSQIELRVLAEVTGEPNLIQAFKDGLDLHSITASQMFGVPLEDVKDKHPEKRKAAKAINFGVAYGLGPMSLSQELHIPMQEARRYIDSYFEANSSVREWRDRTQEEGLRTWYSTTAFGRKRFFRPIKVPTMVHVSGQTRKVGSRGEQEDVAEWKRMTSSYRRRITNHVIQGTSADITKAALIEIHGIFAERRMDAALVMVVHDEIVVECHEAAAEEAALVVVDCMKRAASAFLEHVPVEVGVNVDDYWAH